MLRGNGNRRNSKRGRTRRRAFVYHNGRCGPHNCTKPNTRAEFRVFRPKRHCMSAGRGSGKAPACADRRESAGAFSLLVAYLLFSIPRDHSRFLLSSSLLLWLYLELLQKSIVDISQLMAILTWKRFIVPCGKKWLLQKIRSRRGGAAGEEGGRNVVKDLLEKRRSLNYL